MTSVAVFSFNPYQENTYVLYDKTKECVIIDPGCYTEEEKKRLVEFIETRELTPVKLLNTHCHIDHVLGNKMVAEKYNLVLETHKGEVPVLEAVPNYAAMVGFPNIDVSPMPEVFLEEGDVITFGETTLEVLFTPGHSPASICFLNRRDNFVIAGDVLFQGSIGRTDLPGGSAETLMDSIFKKLLPLDDVVKVYPGHGSSTTIGFERTNNSFIAAVARGEKFW